MFSVSEKRTNNTRQALWLGIGGLFSFGFAIVSSMILSRYFNKSDYGTYKQVMYVYNTLLTIFTLGLPRAYSFFLPRVDQNQAKNLISKLTKIFILLGAVFSVFLFSCSDLIADFLKNPDLAKALRYFSPVPLLMLPTMGLDGILSTYNKNQFNTIYTVVTRLVMLFCVCVPVIFLDGGYIGAIIGFTVSSFLSFILALYLRYIPIKEFRNDKCIVSLSEIFRFSLPMLTASLWGIVISSSDQFFISRYFGNAVFAEFSNGSMELPFVGMITGACATVLSPIISRLSHQSINAKEELFPLWISVFEKSAKLVYPLLIYCMFFADVVMTLLYGNQYKCSSTYFIIKSFYSFFAVIIYAPLVINIGKVRYYSNVHLIAAILIVILEYVSVKTVMSPYAISVISLLVRLGTSFALLYVVADYFKVGILQLFPIKVLVKIIVPSILILGLERFLLIDLFNINLIVVLFVSFFVYMVLFILASYPMRLDYLNIIKPLINK